MRIIISLISIVLAITSISLADDTHKPFFDNSNIFTSDSYKLNNSPMATNSECDLQKHTDVAIGIFNGLAPNDKFTTYFDPSSCPDFDCEYEINSLRFGFIPLENSLWPMSVDVIVYELSDSLDNCAGPGDEIYRFNYLCDSSLFAFPALGTAIFPAPCTVGSAFYIGIEYIETDSNQTVYPSLMVDSNLTPDSCDNWFYFDIPSNQQWNEWYDFWSSVPGYPFFRVGGNTITPCLIDTDHDGYPDENDNCPEIVNPSQADIDLDGFGDVCDNCPNTANVDQANNDLDNYGNVCDDCPDDANNDYDQDGYCGNEDNCPSMYNPDQTDLDMNNIGDACENCCRHTFRGDINYDDNPLADISDLLYLVDYMFLFPPLPPPPCMVEADLNIDGEVDISDLLWLIDFMFLPPGTIPETHFCP